ncbi:MAG: aminotransferase class I/II-fold pyridoxal phosphate-dependent enzyme [Mariniblastus sp.]|nr:aminotransferase class I/II-fold pyridoxal phosphate-dependent enzyme [Mariniblastus sp.]
MIDLRSDTVTKPSEAMRHAMATAPVGDDVIDADPTVAKLQSTIAEMLGKPAAMFMPSGTMTNQVAVRLHCKPGDELICESGCHIYNYEQGGFAQLSGLVAKTVTGQGSVIQLEQLDGLIHPDNEHAVYTRLVCLENTHNRGGGVVLPYDGVVEICEWAHQNGLKTHLDGARLFNAVVASGISVDQWAKHFDTISVCFSKGLGAPVGSALIGETEMMHEVRRHRKLFGGGMRQSGVIAAGALYAIENNITRLAEDHQTSQIIAQGVSQIEGFHLEPERVDTNIVIFKIDRDICTAHEMCDALYEAGVWVLPFSREHVRAVTHLHITPDQAESACRVIQQVAHQRLSRARST